MSLKLYDHATYQMRVVTQIGRFYKAPDRDVLVIAVEHLRGGRGIEVFYTTDLDADVETVLRRYSWRWSIAVTFHDCQGHPGIDEPQNRTTMAARRTAATGSLLYSLIVWWHEATQKNPPNACARGPECRGLRSQACLAHSAQKRWKIRGQTFLRPLILHRVSINS